MASQSTPANIFQEAAPNIFQEIGKNPQFNSVTMGLQIKVITDDELDEITSKNLADNTRGNQLTLLLKRKIKSSEDPFQCLLEICAVLESEIVNNDVLRKQGRLMREKLLGTTETTGPSSTSTAGATRVTAKADQTSGHQGKKIDKDNGHDETDSGSQDGATQPPKQDSEKKKSDEPQGENPPELPKPDEEYESTFKSFDDIDVTNLKILLLPATKKEEKAVLRYLQPIDGEEYIQTRIYDGKIPNIHIGKYGKNPVVVVKTAPQPHKQGPVHAAIVITKMLEKFTSIKYIVAVGVCYGMDKNKQKLGQVIVSTILCDFTNIREGKTQLTKFPRGPQDAVESSIGNMFQPTGNISELPKGADEGIYICTPSLIDNDELKEEYKDIRKDAIAGEMEGAGLTAAAGYTTGVEVIVIKGIGDWGDGTKGNTGNWKEYAAHASAYYVKTVLEKETVN